MTLPPATRSLVMLLAFVMFLVAIGLTTAAPAEDTGRQITDTGQLFRTLDVDQDGLLRQAEIDPRHKQLYLRLLKHADANDDGALDAKEWASGLNPPKRDRPLEQVPEPVAEEDKPSAVFARLDRNSNNNFDRGELPPGLDIPWDSVVKIADKDGNGAIERREFLRSYPALARQVLQQLNRKRDNALAMFERWDADGDGKVTLAEVPAQRREKVEMRFTLADSNADGALDRKELKAAFAAPELELDARLPPAAGGPQAKPKPQAQNFIDRDLTNLIDRGRELDRDGDGVLSREEARGPLARHFQRFDTNGDGSVDETELAKAAKVIARWRKNQRAGKPQ